MLPFLLFLCEEEDRRCPHAPAGSFLVFDRIKRFVFKSRQEESLNNLSFPFIGNDKREIIHGMLMRSLLALNGTLSLRTVPGSSASSVSSLS